MSPYSEMLLCVSQEGVTALHAAARNGHAEVLSALLDRGAAIDAAKTVRDPILPQRPRTYNQAGALKHNETGQSSFMDWVSSLRVVSLAPAPPAGQRPHRSAHRGQRGAAQRSAGAGGAWGESGSAEQGADPDK